MAFSQTSTSWWRRGLDGSARSHRPPGCCLSARAAPASPRSRSGLWPSCIGRKQGSSVALSGDGNTAIVGGLAVRSTGCGGCVRPCLAPAGVTRFAGSRGNMVPAPSSPARAPLVWNNARLTAIADWLRPISSAPRFSPQRGSRTRSWGTGRGDHCRPPAFRSTPHFSSASQPTNSQRPAAAARQQWPEGRGRPRETWISRARIAAAGSRWW
jgi:hypothetical protein